jgi:exopolysaccharide biosynthesis polyprenyl glycosylphosphotransferase
VGFAVAFVIADALEGRSGIDTARLPWLIGALIGWIALLRAYGLYDHDLKRVSHTTIDDVPQMFQATIIGAVLLWAYYRVVPVPALVASEVVVSAALVFPGVLLCRAVARSVLSRALGPERTLLVGVDPGGLLTRKLHAHPEYGVEPIGLLTAGDQKPASSVAHLGPFEEVNFERVLRDLRVDRVIAAHTGLPDGELFELIHGCRTMSVKVSLLPRVSDALGPSVAVDDLGGLVLLGVNLPVLSRSSRLLKRTMDVLGSSLALVFNAPLLALMGVAIKLDSRGPVLFRQERIGRAGRTFTLLKFRTMVVDAEEKAAGLWERSRDPNWLHIDDDPRVTRVGRLLRLTSLDELPQLWNVLRGQMSLVGPRPLTPSDDHHVTGWARDRLDLTPGLTGLWQVLGRTSIPFTEMVKLDYVYVTNWSLWTDVRLILRTIPVVLTRRGAN